jgi:hypothetical protein
MSYAFDNHFSNVDLFSEWLYADVSFSVPVDKMFIEKMPVDETIGDRMSVDKMYVDEMSLDVISEV